MLNRPTGTENPAAPPSTIVHSNIQYHNIRGMTFSKFSHYSTLLYTPIAPDIVILSETWFQHSKTYSKHPTFIWSTPKPPEAERNRKRKNGIAIFAKPGVQDRIRINCFSPYDIHFTLDSVNYLAVYFPPASKTTPWRCTYKR